MRNICVVLVLLMISCGANSSVNIENDNAVSISKVDFPQISYLFFEVDKKGESQIITLKEQKKAKGTVKKENDIFTRGEKYFYKISLLDSKNEIVKSFVIDHPLKPLMESYSPEGINKNQMNLNHADFFIRYNDDANISSVQVEELDNDSSKVIFKQKL